jgi:hypothetical protein
VRRSFTLDSVVKLEFSGLTRGHAAVGILTTGRIDLGKNDIAGRVRLWNR